MSIIEQTKLNFTDPAVGDIQRYSCTQDRPMRNHLKKTCRYIKKIQKDFKVQEWASDTIFLVEL